MKNYRKRAAESFKSGIESPLEALGTRALREAQAELQSRAAASDDRDPDALAMLDEALAHEPKDAHERRAAARAYLGVTKSASRGVETKGSKRDFWNAVKDVVAAAQGENLSEDIFDAVNALRDANDSEECFDNLTIIAESAGSSTAMQDAADRALEYYDEVGTDKERSASGIKTKGAMPIVAFDAANEEGLDDLEADVNDLAYKHNASGMDADTSGGHCEVYFEAAIDAANFVEALQAGDLIGYTVSNLELVPTDGNGDDGEEKNTEGVETKSVDDSFAEIFDAAETAREAYMVVKTLFADSSYAVAQDERDSGVDTTADDWEGDDPLLDGHLIFQNAAIYPSHYEKLFGARINVGPENLAQAYAEVDEWKRIVEEAQDSVASAECSGPLAQKYQDAILGAIPDYLNALDDLRNVLANYEGELEQESADDEDKSAGAVRTKQATYTDDGAEITVEEAMNSPPSEAFNDLKDALDEAGIDYEVSSDGWSLTVSRSAKVRKILKEVGIDAEGAEDDDS